MPGRRCNSTSPTWHRISRRGSRSSTAASTVLDVFSAYRLDEQIAKGLDRKVWLPSGGSLVIDRTEAMTVVDVNTGKFTGSGGNLEETVTKNNLEAAEEIVRQLRLRDIGGIIVVDFIDMVLESNRDLVLRRLVECLGRDRTRHQVAEVTSLGLVQMTRKRIGTGLLEAFSENCESCQGRGFITHDAPIEPKQHRRRVTTRWQRRRQRRSPWSGSWARQRRCRDQERQRCTSSSGHAVTEGPRRQSPARRAPARARARAADRSTARGFERSPQSPRPRNPRARSPQPQSDARARARRLSPSQTPEPEATPEPRADA